MGSPRLKAALLSAGRTLRRPPRWLILALLLAAIELSYVFIITAGTFTNWPTWNTNYDVQAEGFRAGHLHLSVEPPPELLAQRNPFDYAHQRLWFWDASLHDGHYYLYWGPLPALGLAAVKAVLRINVPVGDQYPLFVFYTIYLVAGAVLIDRMARRLFDDLPLWLVVVGILVFAYANPTPFMIGTPGIYEAAIAAGQAFLVAGLLFAFDAVWADGDGPRARRALLLAGVAWGLGLGCRVSVAPTVALILLAAVFLIRRTARGVELWKARFRDATVGAAPLAVVLIGLLAYNKARFGSWFDFGISSQMSTMPMRHSFAYVGINLFEYLFRPLFGSCRFPFLTILSTQRGFPSWLTIPKDYWTPEPLAGMLVATPWAWLTPVAAIFAGRLAIRAWRGRRGGFFEDPRLRVTLWCAISFVLLATVTGLPTIRIFIATMRYLADVMSGVLLFCIWGAWSLHRQFSGRAWSRRLVGAILVGLAGLTVIVGLLLGLQGYNAMFEGHNPALFAHWVRLFSRC